MVSKRRKEFLILLVILAGSFLSMPVRGQTEAADTLESQLNAKYKKARVGTDSSGVSIIETGTVLVVKKGGILGFASGNVAVAPTFVKEGEVHVANNTVMTGVNRLMKWKGTEGASTETKFLTVGEKVYVTKIDVHNRESRVAFAIIECDSCNEVKDPSSRKAQVVFQFPKGYLENSDGGQISDTVNQILEIQTDDGSQSQGQDANQGQPTQAQQQDTQPQQPQQAEAPPQPPPHIQKGQSLEQVTAALGQPEKTVDLGLKQIYVYKDLKITFLNGKVAQVQ